MEEAETTLRDLLFYAPMPTKYNWASFGRQLRVDESTRAALGYILQAATDRALKLRSFNMAQDHAAALFSNEQGVVQGLEFAVNMILDEIDKATQKEPEDATQSPDEE